MNWFQIVFLREDSQVAEIKPFSYVCCELISNCIFTWGFTSAKSNVIKSGVLWIDFKLYFYVRIHKFNIWVFYSCTVVNWFQIVFLREDSQALKGGIQGIICCELISNCIFTWGFTSSTSNACIRLLLWIDFKLYFYVRIHKYQYPLLDRSSVVNWFQIVFLREDSQVFLIIKKIIYSCELISNCIFTWGFTSRGGCK